MCDLSVVWSTSGVSPVGLSALGLWGKFGANPSTQPPPSCGAGVYLSVNWVNLCKTILQMLCKHKIS